MNTLTNIQKLEAIYAATRAAPLNADQHDSIRQMASQLVAVIKEAEEAKATAQDAAKPDDKPEKK